MCYIELYKIALTESVCDAHSVTNEYLDFDVAITLDFKRLYSRKLI